MSLVAQEKYMSNSLILLYWGHLFLQLLLLCPFLLGTVPAFLFHVSCHLFLKHSFDSCLLIAIQSWTVLLLKSVLLVATLTFGPVKTSGSIVDFYCSTDLTFEGKINLWLWHSSARSIFTKGFHTFSFVITLN